MKKLIVLMIVLLLFTALHCYTEDKFSDTATNRVTEQLVDWAN